MRERQMQELRPRIEANQKNGENKNLHEVTQRSIRELCFISNREKDDGQNGFGDFVKVSREHLVVKHLRSKPHREEYGKAIEHADQEQAVEPNPLDVAGEH